jgi:hypothetical protein
MPHPSNLASKAAETLMCWMRASSYPSQNPSSARARLGFPALMGCRARRYKVRQGWVGVTISRDGSIEPAVRGPHPHPRSRRTQRNFFSNPK